LSEHGGAEGGATVGVAVPRSYSEYLELARLLDLQRPLAVPEVPDEMLFIIVHQTHELWFKQILFELATLVLQIDTARWQAACQTLDRLTQIVTLLVGHLAVLESMPAAEFQRFRAVLGTASGMQSEQFRRMETLLGHVPESDPASPRGGSATRGLREVFLQALDRAAGALRVDQDARGGAEKWQSLLSELYRDPALAAPRAAADRLLALDQQMAEWRQRHLQMVRAMIGAVAGTGGSAGVRYLQTNAERRFFPELWPDALGAPAP
jgi:tryptophan 2,3-dioxygenase